MCNSLTSYTNKVAFNEATKEQHLIYIIKNISSSLIEECKRAMEGSTLSKALQERIECHAMEVRQEIVKKQRNGCDPLFIACKRGCVEIVQYLVVVCGADIEQRGQFEVPEDRSFHFVSPLWCAAVSGKLEVIKYLVLIGCDINAQSDSGSTPVRSACFMTHLDIVKYLVENGADIKKPNINGGTCLINSVQSVQLCSYLIQKGADVNAKDIQSKTALHYAIQEHRLETTKLLLANGADAYAKSLYGDDALRTACLKGSHQIFDYLKTNLRYPIVRLAEAHELIGSTFLDEHNENRVAILHWRLAHHIRLRFRHYLEKTPTVPLRIAYGNSTEFNTLEELDNIAVDADLMRYQSLLICERILGVEHKDMLFRLMFRGATYADALRFQKCIDLWRLALEIRVNKFSVLYSDTCFTAQALVRLMLDLHDRCIEVLPTNQKAPLFYDVLGIFQTLTTNMQEVHHLLSIKPVFRKQQENFDRVFKCCSHLIYLLIETASTAEERKILYKAVLQFVKADIRSICTNDTLLHLSVSRLNMIKSGYFGDEQNSRVIFPNASVIKVLIDCGIKINARNDSKSSALHVAALPYNFDNEILLLLLNNGSDIDQPNKANERPINMISSNPLNTIPLMNYMNLQCLAVTIINKYRIPYRNYLPKLLEELVKDHES